MRRLLYIIPVLLLLGACSSYQYHTTRVQQQDFSQYRTYGWLPPVDSLSKSFFDNDIARSNILDLANDEIEARGLSYTQDNPDLLFRYIAIVNNKSRTRYASPYMYGPYMHSPWGWGGWGGWGYHPMMWHGGSYPVGKERFRAGHLIIEAVDRKTNSVVWQARGTGEVRNPERAINSLPKMIQGVMKQFPVNARK